MHGFFTVKVKSSCLCSRREMEEHGIKYILLCDRVGLTPKSTRIQVLRGELLEGVPLAEQPTDSTRVAVVGIGRRYQTFQDRKRLPFGRQLVPGSAVFVEIRGTIKAVGGVVEYIGELPPRLRTWFGVELIRNPGEGTCNGTFGDKQYFICSPEFGVFVGLDKLTPREDEDDLKSHELASKDENVHVQLEELYDYIGEEKDSSEDTYVFLRLELDEIVVTRRDHAACLPLKAVIPEKDLDDFPKQGTGQEAQEELERIHEEELNALPLLLGFVKVPAGTGKEFVMRLRRTDSMIPGEGELIMAAGGPLSEFECKNLPSHQVDDVIMHDEERTDRAEVPYFKDDHFECFPPDDYVQVERRIEAQVTIAQGQLPEKQDQSEKSETQISRMEEQLTNTQGQLQEKHDQLEKSEAQVRRMEEQLTNAQGQLQEKHDQLENSEALLSRMEEQLTYARGQLQGKHDQLENSEAQVRRMEEQLTNAQVKLQEKHDQSVHSEAQVSRIEERLTNAQGQLQEKHNQLENSEALVRRMEEQLTNIQGQLQEKHDLLENSEALVRRMEEQLTNLQRQLVQVREVTQQLTNDQGQSQEKDEEIAISQNQLTILERRLREKNQDVIEVETSFLTAQQLAISEPQRQESPDWVLSRDQVEVTKKCLGSGGWASVMEGRYCGCAVAVKQIHNLIISPYSRGLFEREMDIASRCRHPCLLQFIRATNDEESPLFVTKLMETSLRALIEQRSLARQPLSATEVSAFSLDVARALNYLHQKRPSSIIHRDISSAKVSDYGTANFKKKTMTPAPGAAIYSAPEALTRNQTVKVDVFSFGVLCEMSIQKMPDPNKRKQQVASVTNPLIRALI
ncbi:putative serine/threonine-protein kinase [Stylophora pistillata]|uniref:Putative serine/threonine-protein kinase n=1 Tax=Stylophora pistillata TaxID=50429 RepID=A0A2B4R258_STYPI|nr:putative serine/threonine-protein kinase [Stylophora pistillata]